LALGQARSVLITSRTPKEATSRSLIAALFWLIMVLATGLGLELFFGLVTTVLSGTLSLDIIGLVGGLVLGAGLGLRNGGRFVVLQKVAYHRLARAGNLPPRPADFLEWGIERQIFRRVGGGVRFRHSLIQQHLANS